MAEDNATVMLAIFVEAFKAGGSNSKNVVGLSDLNVLSNQRDKCISNNFTPEEIYPWMNSNLATWFLRWNKDLAELIHEKNWTFQSISYLKRLEQRINLRSGPLNSVQMTTTHNLFDMLEAWENIYQGLPKNMRNQLSLNEIVMSGIDMDEIVEMGYRFTSDMAESIRIMGQLN